MALDALNRLCTTAAANINALANAKLQLINDLRSEVEKMKAASEEVYETPRAQWASQLKALKHLSESMRHFYMTLPRISIMRSPGASEYSSLSKDMPALPLFAHHAVGMMEELNEHIKFRNALIAEHAREGGTGDGMSAERLIYYSSMLAGVGNGICEQTDDALDFWRLVLDQVKAYMEVKAKGEHSLKYELVPEAVAAMPQEELFPLMRDQLVTFDS